MSKSVQKTIDEGQTFEDSKVIDLRDPSFWRLTGRAQALQEDRGEAQIELVVSLYHCVKNISIQFEANDYKRIPKLCARACLAAQQLNLIHTDSICSKIGEDVMAGRYLSARHDFERLQRIVGYIVDGYCRGWSDSEIYVDS